MDIRYRTWRRFTRVGGILAVPVVLFLFIRPHWGIWSGRLVIAAYIFVFLLGGAGGLLAILKRAGVVRMIYSDSDKQSMNYQMAKTVAERERQAEFGSGFSDSYYESLEVKPPKQSRPDK